jgi:hypothetical protein
MHRFSKQNLARLGVTVEELIFCLGSLIYPKQMLQLLAQAGSSDQIKVI